MTTEVQRFLDEHEAALRPLDRAARLALWEASTTGSESAARHAARLSADLRKLYADAAALARVHAWLKHGDRLDPLIRRQLVLLEHSYTANQLPPALIDELEERAQEIEHVFNTYRVEIEGAAVTDNEVRRLLQDEGDTERRRAAWEGSKRIGERVADRLRALARRRNEAARSLGFPDYYRMQLLLQEIEPAALDAITADVAQRTAAPFAREKAAMDAGLAERLGIAPAELRPWHYADPFFQEPPAAGDVDLDPLFARHDVVALSAQYFRSIGLPVEDVLARSDLYERTGKDQHAFCTDIDREGDVRVLCNVRSDARWMGTMLHELGHAVYDLHARAGLPYLLRGPAHMLTTEAIAMHFGALVREPAWLRATLGASVGDATVESALRRSRTRDLLVFARWALVMIRFEREFYAAPDRADLNEVWWRHAGELQGLASPPDVPDRFDWATKIHLAVAPVYYHNYLLGELYAAQLRARLLPAGGGDAGVGTLLRERVFAPGASLRWDELVSRSTGRPLDAADFAAELDGGY